MPENYMGTAAGSLAELAQMGNGALPGGGLSVGGYSSPPYVGQVAGNCSVPNNTSTSAATQCMARSRHRAGTFLNTASQMKLVLPAFYVNASTFVESSMGASLTWSAAIEYPAGTICGQVLFSGATSITAPNVAGTVVSDAITLAGTIPAGATFFVRMYVTGAQGVPYTSNLGQVIQDTTNGEGITTGTSVTNNTMVPGTNPVSSNAFSAVRPLAIIAKTTVPSIYLLGDSRYTGYGDAFVGTATDLGYPAKVMGNSGIPYINASVSGDSLALWNVSNTIRASLARYCSLMAIELGGNDLVAGALTDLQLRSQVATAMLALPNIPAIIDTIPPGTASTDTFATTTNQTALSPLVLGTGSREQHNNWRRTVPAPFVGCAEVADQVETGRNTGYWRVNGTASAWTIDGRHPSPMGYTTISNSGVFLAAFSNVL